MAARTLAIASAAALFIGLLSGYWLTDNIWSAKWADAERDAAQAQLKAVDDAIKSHTLRVTELEKVNDETKQKLTDAFVAARNADAESDRLQHALDDYLRRSSAKHCATSTTSERAAAATDQLVLAELFRRADKRAGELAAIADDNRIRGLACEEAYKAIH